MYLFFIGFIAAYLLSFNLTTCALLLPILLGLYKIFLSSSIMVKEISGLFISNPLAVISVKLYLFMYGLKFDNLSGLQEISY